MRDSSLRVPTRKAREARLPEKAKSLGRFARTDNWRRGDARGGIWRREKGDDLSYKKLHRQIAGGGRRAGSFNFGQDGNNLLHRVGACLNLTLKPHPFVPKGCGTRKNFSVTKAVPRGLRLCDPSCLLGGAVAEKRTEESVEPEHDAGANGETRLPLAA